MYRISDSIIANPQRWALAAFIFALGYIAWFDGRPALHAIAETPKIPGEVVAQVLPVAQEEIRHGVDSLDKRIGQGLDDANKRISDALAISNDRLDQGVNAANSRLDQAITAANTRLGELTATAAGIRSDLKPTLDNTAALVKDGKDSLDDLYPDIKASTESATVAVTSFAQASEAIRDAAPKVTASVVKVGQNSDAATEKALEASEETRRLMFNLAENTTPLPKWVRWPAQIIGILGTAAVPVVTIEQMVKH